MSKKTSTLPYGAKKVTDDFDGKVVYYSGSIQGNLVDPEIGYLVVKYMLENGAEVSSAHVAARNSKEMLEIFVELSGRGLDKDGNDIRDPAMAYEVDMGWVDEATHIVAVVDGPSHGVGMEIMRALFKPSRGLNDTPVLCLVHEDNHDKISWMIRGADSEFGDMITIGIYTDVGEATKIVDEFLSKEI